MTGSLAATFVDAIRQVVGDEPFVGLHVPEIGDVEKQYVDACLDSTFVSSVGEYVGRFENEIADFVGAKHAVAVSNGTSALQVAFVLAGVRPGDEIMMPALSFIATANAASHAGATSYFVDSSVDTIGMDPAALARELATLERRDGGVYNRVTGARVAAIAPMHAFGHPVDILAIAALAEEYGIPLVEDAAESLGSYVGGRHTGTFGRLGVISFNGNKILTTGGGGMIVTDDAELARHAKHVTTTAKLPHEWEFEHDEVAWNFRMPNLNAALGVAQFTRLPGFIEQKRALAARYRDVFAGIDGVTFITEPAGTSSNYWLCSVRLDEPNRALRDEILRATNDAGLQCRPIWNLLSEQRMYVDTPRGDLSTAKALQDSIISMPSSPKLAGVLP